MSTMKPESYDPTSEEECKAFCVELGLDPEKFWGIVNDFACDCYHRGCEETRAKAKEEK